MALDKPTTMVVEQFRRSGLAPVHELTPQEARSRPSAIPVMPTDEMSAVTDVNLTSSGGGTFSARVLVPQGRPEGTIVYLHGGGWVLSGIDQFDSFGRHLANRTQMVVVLVDYRKAPEHPYPTAVEDCWSALNWAASSGLGAAQGAPLFVAGDSAGGNLATVLAIRARDEGSPFLAGQILSYPVTDCDLNTPSYLDEANALILTRETMEWFFGHYCLTDQRERPDISPLRAPSLAGLPPAIIALAEHDVLRSEGEKYADRLSAEGNTVISQTFAGQMHGFATMLGVLPGADKLLDFIAGEVTKIATTHSASRA